MPHTEPPSSLAEEGFPGWRRNLAFTWLGVFVGLMGANFVFPFVPFFIKDLGVTDKAEVGYWAALSASVTGLSLTLTAPVWGSLADRVGRKRMFLRALFGAGVLIILMGFVQSVWQFVALRFALGAFAGTMGSAAALVAATTPRERTGRALGTLQTAMFSANMLGPFIGGTVSASIGIRESFFFCGSLYLVAMGLAWVFIREPAIAPVAAASGKKGSGSLVGNLRIVVSERQVVIMLGLLFCLWLSTTFVRPIMPISIDNFAGHDTGNAAIDDHVRLHLLSLDRRFDEKLGAGLVFGMIGLTSTLAALTVAPLGQRIGYRTCVAGAAIMTGVLFVPVALAGNYTSFLLFMAATGLFQGAMVPGTNALIAASVPDGKQGAAFGLAASMQSLALLVGPLAGGAVNGMLGMHAVYASLAAILVAAGAVGYMLVREPELYARPVPGTPTPAPEPADAVRT